MFKKLWYNDTYKIFYGVDENDKSLFKGCWCYEALENRIDEKVKVFLDEGYKIFFNKDTFQSYLNNCLGKENLQTILDKFVDVKDIQWGKSNKSD